MVLAMTLDLLKNHPKIPCISVNVSTNELASPSYSAEVLELVQASGIDAQRLELEITERAAIVDEASERHLLELSRKGIKISIDDFGTGETRFDYLAKFQVDVIKIDMSLVQKFENAPQSYSKLLQAICAVGKACNMVIVAEGIESLKVAESLVSLGINKFQGYHFGKPVGVEQFLLDHAAHLN
jgi:EAL domain-containing protein (putative c-di-GMP-specific phosphodiesterase class I)